MNRCISRTCKESHQSFKARHSHMSSYPATNVVTFSQLFCLARASSTGHMRSHAATPSQPSLTPHPLASSHHGISPVVSNISGTCYPVMPHRVQRHRTWALLVTGPSCHQPSSIGQVCSTPAKNLRMQGLWDPALWSGDQTSR
jgi:hypothetical protein